MKHIRDFSVLVLIVEDISKSFSFYRDVVGLSVESRSDDWICYYVGETNNNQRLALHKGKLLFEEKSPLPEGRRFGQIHFAFEVERNNLEQALEIVKYSGTEVYDPQIFEWMKAVSYFFYDPDGNLIEYWSPNN
jgi:catechol 2,3-dioxygenase-like lactoylglutathione lyase family enzyme